MDSETSETWKEFASRTREFFSTGAVNCDTEEEICEDLESHFSNNSTPVVTFFSEDPAAHGEIYEGKIHLEKLLRYAKKKIPSNITILTSSNISRFLNNDPFLHKVLIFVKGKRSPKLLRSLSQQFKGVLKFGEIGKSETSLHKKYEVTKFPSIIIARDEENFVTFSGNINRDSLLKIFLQYTKNKRSSSDILQFTSDVYNNMCNKRDARNICVLFVNKNNSLSDDTKSFLEKLASRYATDAFRFFYVNQISIRNFKDVFMPKDQDSSVFVVRGRRNKYCAFHGKVGLQELIVFLDKILSGGGVYRQLKNAFLLRDVKTEL